MRADRDHPGHSGPVDWRVAIIGSHRPEGLGRWQLPGREVQTVAPPTLQWLALTIEAGIRVDRIGRQIRTEARHGHHDAPGREVGWARSNPVTDAPTDCHPTRHVASIPDIQ